MSFATIMSTIRDWDNRCSRWMMRHFYFLFFQFVLVAAFVFFFRQVLEVINLSMANPGDLTTSLLVNNSISLVMIVFLLILNSFWMLFVFNGLNRIRLILKDINYNLTRQKQHPR